MKKYYLVIAVTILTLLQISCSKEPVQLKKEWTFLFYDDADFYNAYDPLNDFSRLVSSDSKINYLVLRDGNKTEASYYQIDQNHEQILLKSLDELNMGDKSTLENFFSYAQENFPAERYIVAFYDHGGGWQGACWDMTSNNDNLTPAEMNDALSEYGGVDLVLFTAPCLMGSVECAYQFRESSKYYIGSENLSGFAFWLGMLEKLDAFLKDNSDVTSQDLAKEIITLHEQNKNAYGYGASITMSAVDLSKMSNLISSLNNVTNYYSENIGKFNSMPRENIKKYYSDYFDLLSLLKSLRENETESLINNQLTETINLFNMCIVAECHGDSTAGSNGLNIYLPSVKYSSEIYYSPYGIGLDFKSDCSWDKLIGNYLNNSKASSPDERLINILRLNEFNPE